MLIPRLSIENLLFPNVDEAIRDRNGLVAIGGDLSVERLLSAYQQGIFPWFSIGEPICWWALSPRMVLLVDDIHIGRSLVKNIKNQFYCITVNHAFSEVIKKCAYTKRVNQHGTWITPEMITAYRELHLQSKAHSFEYWIQSAGKKELVGGLYGVQIGKVFFGESMFAKVSNASKITFVHAVNFLAKQGIELIDCQMHTHHLARFGAKEISFTLFRQQLNSLCPQDLLGKIEPQIIYEHLN